jgi:hypothetical protein
MNNIVTCNASLCKHGVYLSSVLIGASWVFSNVHHVTMTTCAYQTVSILHPPLNDRDCHTTVSNILYMVRWHTFHFQGIIWDAQGVSWKKVSYYH